MKGIIGYFIKHPIWANVLMFGILLAGFICATQIKTSFFPEIKSNVISIDAAYQGTSPEEIEKGIVLKIEENLEGLEGIEDLISVSQENVGRVQVIVLDGYDMNEMLADVKNAVDRISNYPAGAEKPVVSMGKSRHRTLELAIFGEANLWALKTRAEELRDNLVAVPGISQVTVTGLPQREISIEVKESILREYALTFDDFVRAVRGANVDISGGRLETAEEEILIRSRGKKYHPEDIKKIVLQTTRGGSLLRVGDVADVTEKWSENTDETYYNGKRSILINVDKTLDEDILFVAEEVKRQVEAFAQSYPDLNVKIIVDRTVHLNDRINLLKKNGLIGVLLVVLSLGLFLNVRLSFWVSLGIPISFAGMFIIAYIVGITINVISLFGMIVVVGMLVDDAIVVAESIYQNHEKGMTPLKASVDGTLQVMAPVFTAVLTTIIAFIPFFFMTGRLGKIFWQIALVVIAALIFSLIESLLILPAHLAHSKGLAANAKPPRLRRWLDGFFAYSRDRLFGPVLKLALRNKLATIAVPLALGMVIVGLLKGEIVGVSPFPRIPQDNFNVNISLKPGGQEQVTDSVLQIIEKRAWELNETLKKKRPDGKDVILSIQRILGTNALRESGGHAGQLKVELLKGEERNIPPFAIANQLREKVGFLPLVNKIEFGGGGRWGKPVSVSLLGSDYRELKKAANMLKVKLMEYSSLKDVNDNDVEGRREINIELTPKAHSLGLSVQEVARQIRQGFFGQEVQRLQRGRDEIRIWVRYTKEDRNSMNKLENMFVKTPAGEAFPLRELVDFSIERGIVTVVHLNGKREIKVEADLEDQDQPVPPIMNEIMSTTIPEVLSHVKGVRVAYSGREKDDRKFNTWFWTTFMMALGGILAILMLVFRSYIQAVIIFIMIPTGLIGAVLGHWYHGKIISRLSMFGIIALSGIIINDSIVYIDQINKNIKKGMKVFDAVYEAGISRFRPILLTTVTTVIGLAPLINETSRQAQYLIPMAISIAWGLAIGSFMILFVVPTLFLTINSFRYWLARYFRWQITGVPGFSPSEKEITHESVEPMIIEKERNEELE